MRLRSISVFCLLLVAPAILVASGCPTRRPYYDYAAEPDPRKQDYVMGPSDLLRINVWRNPDLSVESVVRPDGTISMPLVGDLQAAGRTPSQLRAEIAKRLTAYLKDESATVTVTVAAVNSYRFVVSGNVEHGGAFAVNHYVKVSEAIALAGGPNKYANPDETVIIRQDPPRGVKRIPIDYLGILSGRHPEHDLTVVAGDTIFVP